MIGAGASSSTCGAVSTTAGVGSSAHPAASKLPSSPATPTPAQVPSCHHLHSCSPPRQRTRPRSHAQSPHRSGQHHSDAVNELYKHAPCHLSKCAKSRLQRANVCRNCHNSARKPRSLCRAPPTSSRSILQHLSRFCRARRAKSQGVRSGTAHRSTRQARYEHCLAARRTRTTIRQWRWSQERWSGTATGL